MNEQVDLSKFNQRVQQWAKETTTAMKQSASELGVRHRENSPSSSPSLSQLRGVTTKHNGGIDKISFKFPRILIYVQKGAGKGRGGNKGSSWVDRFGIQRTTNSHSLGKAGTGGRVAKPFLNTVIEKRIEALADIVAEETGDAIIKAMFVK